MAEYNSFFMDGANLESSTGVFTTNALTTLAADGYYSDGLVTRRQISSGLLPVEDCPACSEFLCEQNITIEPVEASANFINYKMNASLGAIKVTISKVVTKLDTINPTGIFIKGTGALPPSVNSFSSVGISGATNNVITAPSDTVPSYFFANSSTGCSNWTAGSAELPSYNYNPNTQVFEPTGSLNSYSFANKLTTPSAGLTNTTGDIITYIPKTTAALDILQVSLINPCGVPSANITVECPTSLHEFNGSLNLNVQEDSGDACDSSLVSRVLVHGKVRGTVNGQFKNGDYIFTSNNLGSGIYNELPDGYWKSLRTYFPEATGGGSNNNCSFRVINNIISNVLPCQ